MSRMSILYNNGKLQYVELTKFLLNDLLDDIDYLTLYEQKDKIVEIEKEVESQIKTRESIKVIAELSKDLDLFFKNGGDYNSLEDRIKKATNLDMCSDSIMNVYDVYLENVYKFVLFESFIGRRTLLENQEIKDMVNDKLKNYLHQIQYELLFMGSYAEDPYRYLNPSIMADVFNKSNIMSEELRDKLFIEEFKVIDNNHNESIKTIKNKKKKLLKLRIILGAFALGGAVSLGSAGVSTVRLINGTNHITHEEGHASETDKLFSGIIFAFLLTICGGFTLFLLSELKDELELDEEHYKKLCVLLEDLKITSDKYIDVNKLKETMNKYLKEEAMILVDDKGRIVLPDGTVKTITLLDHKRNGIPIPEIRTDLKEEEEYMKKLARQTIKDVSDADIGSILEFGKDYSPYFDEFGRLILPDGDRMNINNNGSDKELEENLREVLEEVTGNSYAKKM